MTTVISIAIGGALGSVLRYWASTAVYGWMGRAFPYGTLTVNLLGSLLMGLLYVVLVERVGQSSEWRALLIVGFLGAFTTFSTFSIETVLLVESGQLVKAILNIIVSAVACVIAAYAGVILSRSLL